MPKSSRFYTLFILLIVSEYAFAFCSPPSMYSSAPDAPGSYSKPHIPYCLSDYRFSGEHTCKQWEIDSYVNEINDYIRDLNSYIEEAANFAYEASRYAEDAKAYGECEANEAREPLAGH